MEVYIVVFERAVVYITLYDKSAGSNGKSDNGSDVKDHLMPDLCVICLEQEYNAVFVP